MRNPPQTKENKNRIYEKEAHTPSHVRQKHAAKLFIFVDPKSFTRFHFVPNGHDNNIICIYYLYTAYENLYNLCLLRIWNFKKFNEMFYLFIILKRESATHSSLIAAFTALQIERTSWQINSSWNFKIKKISIQVKDYRSTAF